jgi:Transposase zinc-ribbon domain
MARSKGTSVIEVSQAFAKEEDCLTYLEVARWPEGVRCLKCQSDKISKFSTKESTRKRTKKDGTVVEAKVPARHLYQCLNAECGHQFTVTTGTIFHDSHLALQKWFLAVALTCNAKKGLSALQLQRDLNINYRTAWYLSHRIREAMASGNATHLLTGTIEADETYVGGKYTRRSNRARYDKDMVSA